MHVKNWIAAGLLICAVCGGGFSVSAAGQEEGHGAAHTQIANAHPQVVTEADQALAQAYVKTIRPQLKGYVAKNDLEGAAAYLTQWIKKYPDQYASAALYSQRGLYLAYRNQIEQALADVDKSVALAGEDPFMYFNRSLVYAAVGRLTESLSDLDKAESLGEQEGLPRNFFSSVKLARSVSFYDRSLAYFKEQKYQKALEDIDRSIALERSGRSYGLRAEIDQSMGDHAAFQKDAQQAITLQQASDISFFANIAIHNGDREKAVKVLTQAIDRGMDDWSLLGLRATAYLDMGKYDEAIQDLTAAMERNKDLYLYGVRSWAYIRGEKYDLARQDIEKALSMQPGNPDFLDTLGYLDYLEGHYEKAVQTTTKAIQNWPMSTTYRVRAAAYRKLGKIELASQDETRAKELADIEAQSPDSRFQLDMSLEMMKRILYKHR